MSVKSTLVAVCILAVGAGLLPAADAFAQAPAPEGAQTTTPTKIFKLRHDSATAAQDLAAADADTTRWVPGLRPGTMELSMSLGFMNLSGVLLEHEQMIYKYTIESTYWGDVRIKGQTAFNPVLRLGYTLYPWLTIEGYGGLSISEYAATVESRFMRKNDQEARPIPAELGAFDAEARSLITLQGGIGVLVYPLNFKGNGDGRVHPYVTGLVGGVSYDMNSDFTDGPAGSRDLAFGAGLRLLAERNISLRIEATYHWNSIEFTPAEYFLATNENTTLVPLMEYPRLANGQMEEKRITSFAAQDLSYLAWSLGFQGSF
jgi:hypothetical protein